MFGMALTRPSLTVQLTSGMDVFVHVCGQKADTLSNYCDNMTRDVSFLSPVTWFLDCFFFWKLPHIRYSNFRKIVQQHVGSIIWVLRKIYVSLNFPAVKEFWKSVKNWQSYRHEFGVLLFWDSVLSCNVDGVWWFTLPSHYGDGILHTSVCALKPLIT